MNNFQDKIHKSGADDIVYISKIKNTNLKESVRFCLDPFFKRSLPNSSKILIKPNFLNSSPAESGVTTDIRIIESVIQILKENEFNNITLAEAGFSDTENIFEKLNIYSLNKYNVRIINLEKEEQIINTHPDAFIFDKISLPRCVVESDIIINIPKLKTHALTTVSLGMKNLFGFLNPPQRRRAHSTDIDKSIIDIYTFLSNKLNKHIFTVVDAVYCLDGKLGPNIGVPVKLDLIISGKDIISVDSICTKIMGGSPKNIRHLLLCEKYSLSILNNQETTGCGIEEIKYQFTFPSATVSIYPVYTRFSNIFFRKRPVIEYPSKCTSCFICVNTCPKDCIKITNGRPKIDYSLCIGCLCCAEGCPQKVYSHKMKNAFIFYLAQKAYKTAGKIIKKLKQ